MSTVVVFVGGTMDTETMLVERATVGSITIPAEPGLPEETYTRVDLPHDNPVRFRLAGPTTTKGTTA